MAFQEDPDLFFQDFGLSFVAGAVSGLCILEQPGMMLFREGVISEDYMVIARQDLFGHLRYGNAVTVAGRAYVVKDCTPVTDGTFCLIRLEDLQGELPPPVPGPDRVEIVLNGDIF